jgi:hypothetical protein
LYAFVDDELLAEERARILSEAEHCAQLRQRLDDLMRVKQLVIAAYSSDLQLKQRPI